jgi:predicted RNA binding protein YcfA (HicA-like mRNA interferase family)
MSLRNHNWRKVLKVLTGFGYVLDRQRGSHMILKNFLETSFLFQGTIQ